MILLLLTLLAPASASLYPGELPWTVQLDAWFRPGFPGGATVKPPDAELFQADKAILVAPLGFEGDRLKAFVCAYRTDELPLPEGTRILRVLVPGRVERVHIRVGPDLPDFPESAILSIPREFDKPLPLGPWREVRYSVERKDGLLLVRPAKAVEGIFAVEALLPTRGNWVRIALTPGSWLVQLGWTVPFDIIRLSDDWVIFQGVLPYDEQYDLGDVKIVLWVCGYFVDLKGREWLRNYITDAFSEVLVGIENIIEKVAESEYGKYDIPFDSQEEAKLVYGPGLIIRISNKIPVVLEFETSPGLVYYGPDMFRPSEHPKRPSPWEIFVMVTLGVLLYSGYYYAYQFPPSLLLLPTPRRRSGERS